MEELDDTLIFIWVFMSIIAGLVVGMGVVIMHDKDEHEGK